MAPVLFTVIVPTRNRLPLLKKLIDRLRSQSLDAHSFTLCVAVDGSTDGTQEWLKTETIPFVETGGNGPAFARNQAARLAEGDFLAFTDDDALPDTDWLLTAQTYLTAHPDAEALEGEVVAAGTKGPLKHWVEHKGKGGGLTCNLIVKRSRFWALDGFNESFRFPMNEDHEFIVRLRRFAVIHYVPALTVSHPVYDTDFKTQWKNAASWVVARTESDDLLFRLHPQEYRLVKAEKTFEDTLKRQSLFYAISVFRRTPGLFSVPFASFLWLLVLLRRQYYFIRRLLRGAEV